MVGEPGSVVREVLGRGEIIGLELKLSGSTLPESFDGTRGFDPTRRAKCVASLTASGYRAHSN
ncbi:MAG: hypothetical protein WCS37_00615 [Chloroflexota bacterium]